MSKYINAELLKKEIESLKSLEYPCDNSEQNVGFENALDRVSDIIDSLQQEQPSEELEEAAEKEMPEEYGFLELDIYGGSETVYTREQMLSMFKSGAEWQASQMPMPEDTVIFQKGIEEGKRLMMEDAVEVGETQLFWEKDGDRAFPTFDPPVEDLLDPGIISLKFEEEDKVKVIIIPIKED